MSEAPHSHEIRGLVAGVADPLISSDGTQATIVGWYVRAQTEALLPVGTEWGTRVFAAHPPIDIWVSATYRQAPGSTMRATARTTGGGPVGPTYDDPFDPGNPFPPVDPNPPPPPEPPGGGGGGGAYQAPVVVRLYPPGEVTPVKEWSLPEGERTNRRHLHYTPEGRPDPAGPLARKGWWRVTVTPQGDRSVLVYIKAQAARVTVPIRTTVLSHRLIKRVLGIVVEAVTPRVSVDGGKYLRVHFGADFQKLYGFAPIALTRELPGPTYSDASLEQLSFEVVPGADVITDVERRITVLGAEANNQQLPQPVRDAARRARDDLRQKLDFHRNGIKPDDIAVRCNVIMKDAEVRLAGFPIAPVLGELIGNSAVIYLVFNRAISQLRTLALLRVRVSLLGELGLMLKGIDFDEREADELVENQIITHQEAIVRYFRDGLGRICARHGRIRGASYRPDGLALEHYDELEADESYEPRPPHADPGADGAGGVGGASPGMVLTGHVTTAATPRPRVGLGLSIPTVPTIPTIAPHVVAAATPRFEYEEGPALARLDQMECLVVIMMENRSFDHLLGDLPQARQSSTTRYDGLPAGASNPAFEGFSSPVAVASATSLGLSTRIDTSPNHHYHHVLAQIADGAMTGFARDVAERTDSPQVAMSFYQEAQLPVYYRLVDEFMVCDQWFCAFPGATWPNRWATLTGATPSLDNFAIDDDRIGYLRERTIFDDLTAAHIDWRFYESDMSIIRTYDRYRLDDQRVLPLDDERDGFAAMLASSATLPRVVFIEPNFVDVAPLATANDDHAPADLADGQEFIKKICNTIWESGRWDRITLVVTYDEHGGFYDHVPPPGTARGGDQWLGRLGRLHPDGPDFMGPRVPTFIMSPMVGAGSVSHVVFDHTSIIKTILVHNRAKFTEPTFASYGPRVAVANHLGQAFDLDAPRTRRPELFAVRGPVVTRRPPRAPVEPDDFHEALRRTFAPRARR